MTDVEKRRTELIGAYDQSVRDEISESHMQLLDERQRALDSGEDHLLDWDEANYLIGKREVS